MELTTLQDWIERAKREYDERARKYEEKTGYAPVITFDDEELPWALQEWYSMRGEFTEEEYRYLQETWDLEPWEVDWFTKPEERE